MRLLQMLAGTTGPFGVHLARDSLPSPQLVLLACGAASARALRSSQNHGDLSQLYSGHGGRVVAVGDDAQEAATAHSETPGENPPRQDEPVPQPPAVLASGPGRPPNKRRRTGSGSS